MRDVGSLLVVAHEASPSGHPAEGALDDPATGQNLEALLVVGSADDLDDEVEIGGLVHEFEPIVGAVGEQMLHPGPALADAVENGLCAGAVGDVGWRQVDHQKGSVRISVCGRP